MNSLISVIVPVYNVERFIKKCVDSILNQTYKNIELILVDDGSPDNCPKICDNYAKKDKRVRVIHKKNGGLSDARNYGLDAAKGEYICFIDSDDYVDSKYVYKLYSAIKKDKTNISQCGIRFVDENYNKLRESTNKRQISSGRDMLIDTYKNKGILNTVVWNRLYSRGLFKNIRFPVGKIHEDEFITYKLLYPEEKVSLIDDVLYNYLQNSTGITKSKVNGKRYHAIEALKERYEYFESKNDNELIKIYTKYCLVMIKKYYFIFDGMKEYQEKILKDYKYIYKKYEIDKKTKFKTKMVLYLFYHFPNIYTFLKR